MTSQPRAQRQVPITDLGLEYDLIKKELTPLLDRILKSGAYVLGPELVRFEKDLAFYLNIKHAVGLNSGTDAVLLALRALDIGAGDEVLVPAMSFFASVEPIIQLGAKPVFVDIDPKSYAIDAAAAGEKVTAKTKAIIAVHLYGQPADMKALSAIAKARNIALIEDMAQSIGASFDGKKVGGWGDIACLSFYPTKNLGACGDAGAVLTSSDALAERVRSLRNHGAKVKYHHEEVAYNSRLDEIQAAILRVKLKHLEAMNRKRCVLADRYHNNLDPLKIIPQQQAKNVVPNYHVFAGRVKRRRDQLIQYCQDNAIQTNVYYSLPLPFQKAHANLGHRRGEFPHAEALSTEAIALPMYPELSDQVVDQVIQTINRFTVPCD